MDLKEEHNKEVKVNEARPVFLTVLCILTLVYAGLSFLAVIYSVIDGPLNNKEVKQLIRESNAASKQYRAMNAEDLAKLNEQITELDIALNNNHLGFGLFNLLAYAVAIAGVVMMLRRMKLGFHFYIIYSFLSLIAFYVFAPVEIIPTAVTVLGLVLSLIFVLMYARNLKWLK